MAQPCKIFHLQYLCCLRLAQTLLAQPRNCRFGMRVNCIWICLAMDIYSLPTSEKMDMYFIMWLFSIIYVIQLNGTHSKSWEYWSLDSSTQLLISMPCYNRNSVNLFHASEVIRISVPCPKLVNQLYHIRMIWLVYRKDSLAFSSDKKHWHKSG